MKYHVKPFSELNTEEFYAIVKERIAVFVVEQNCPYQEVDEIDEHAWHTYFKDDGGNISAYTRVCEAQDAIHFGRVLVNKEHRKEGLGRKNPSTNDRIYSREVSKSADRYWCTSISSFFYESFDSKQSLMFT